MRTPRLARLIGEPLPQPRDVDGLTDDHPVRPFPETARVRHSAWLRALVFAGLFVAGVVLLASVGVAVVGLPLPADSLVVPVAEVLGAVGAYGVLTALWEARRWPTELAGRRAPGLLKGILLGAIAVAVCVGILALLGDYRVGGLNPAYSPWPTLLTIGLFPAVGEEILMRGVLFRLVEEGLGTWGAVAVSAVAFGAGHLANPDATWWGALAIAIEAGVLLAAVYALTRSLWWCIGFHLAWNLMEGPVFGSVVSGTGAADSWLIATWSGPAWLTGGTFGLEGSVVPVVLLGGSGLAILVYLARHGRLVAPRWVRRGRAVSAAGE